MKRFNKPKEIPVRNNRARFEALGKEGRIHLEGSGEISMSVSLNGQDYTPVDHEVQFVEGIAIAPFKFIPGDLAQIEAETLTKVQINYSE